MFMVLDPETIREQLASRLAELQVRAAHVHAACIEPVNPDSSEAATEKEDDEVLEGEEALIMLEIAAVRAAISRLDAGTYGVCARCGQGIDPRRLGVQHEAALCLSCATSLYD